MGAVAKRSFWFGELEMHVTTGKAPVEPHRPQWGPWFPEWGGIEMRQCHHPDCDLDDYQSRPANYHP